MNRNVIGLLPAFWLASCGHDNSAGSASPAARTSSTAPVHRTLEERCNEKVGFVQDSQGNWKPSVDRRSSFDSIGKSPYFKGNYQTKEYRTATLKGTPWWGSKDYTTKTFSQAGADGSRFQKTARADGARSREDGMVSQADGKTVKAGDYKTGAARETKRGDIDHPADAATAARNRTFVPGDAIDWQQQRAMSLDETKSMLGH